MPAPAERRVVALVLPALLCELAEPPRVTGQRRLPLGVVLGTLAMYYRTPYLPTLHEQAMARSASHLAGIVIERNRIDAQLKASLQAEKAARKKNRR